MEGSRLSGRQLEDRWPWRALPHRRRLAALIAVVFTVPLSLIGGYVWGRAAYARQQQLVFSSERYFCPVDAAMLTVQLVPLVPDDETCSLTRGRNSPARERAAGLLDPEGLELACERISEEYGLNCVVGAAQQIPREFFNDGRQQYRVDEILDWLIGQCDPRAFRTIGVMDQDIYAPSFNFLFGQSTMGGSCCVASSARMPLMKRYSRDQAQERWHSILVHELGHALGLQHNADWESVMAFGNSLAELDRQGNRLLNSDWRRLGEIHPIRWDRRLHGQRAAGDRAAAP